jgi:23S rRNA (cytidine1920-2'-O)/16S rRNA (cytidine1409-2'-O)-methyltransferase
MSEAMREKRRLDQVMLEQGLAPTREKARGMIMAGEVLVNGVQIEKPGTAILPDAQITVKARPRFVSRGGDKLAAALDAFAVDVRRLVCADVGASTGGFTDCLLQAGASKVYAIDVGYGQMAYALRQDSRVVMMERTNARYVEKLPEAVRFVCIDASFISLRLLLPVVKGWLSDNAVVIPLIKPQFEAGQGDVGKGGVVRERRVHVRVLQEVLSFAQHSGFHVGNLIRSPLLGPAGNIEFLAYLVWDQNTVLANSLDPLIERVI